MSGQRRRCTGYLVFPSHVVPGDYHMLRCASRRRIGDHVEVSDAPPAECGSLHVRLQPVVGMQCAASSATLLCCHMTASEDG